MSGSVRQLAVTFSVTSQSGQQEQDLLLTQLSLPDTDLLSITRTDALSSDIQLDTSLTADSPVTKELLVDVADVTVPHRLRGTLHYTLVGVSSAACYQLLSLIPYTSSH